MNPLVCITGVTGNLGVFIANLFLQRGCRVLLQSRSHTSLQRVVQQLQQQRGCDAKICSIVADVTTPEGIVTFAKTAQQLQGKGSLHVVHLVGEFPEQAAFAELKPDELRRVMHVNSLSAIDLVQTLTSHCMVESIVLCSSIGAFQPLRNRMHYRLSKMLVNDVVRVLCRELAPHTRINSVAPGAIYGDSAPAGAPKENTIPLAKYGNGNDIAEAIWLLAIEATYVTGQNLTVDGGLSL